MDCEDRKLAQELDRGSKLLHSLELDLDLGKRARLHPHLERAESEDAFLGHCVNALEDRLAAELLFLTRLEYDLGTGLALIGVDPSLLIQYGHLQHEQLARRYPKSHTLWVNLGD